MRSRPISAAAPQHEPSVSTQDPTIAGRQTSPLPLPYPPKKWLWNGYEICYITAGCGDPVILVHGFGLSSAHYRRTMKELAKSYKVYAVDLLGFGRSAKPVMPYTMELFRDQLLAFMAEFTAGKPTTLIGNSIGGLASLMVAADAPEGAVRGLVLLNTAGALNNKGLVKDWRIMLVYPLLLFIDFLLSIPSVSLAIFNSVRSRENIEKALKSVYMNPESVDEELIQSVYAPSCDANAREVFVSILTGPPGPNPMLLMPRITCPLLVLWGDRDMLTPADGPVGKYFQELPARRKNTAFKFLEDVGHCLHDDRPELVHAELLPWLQQLHDGGSTTCDESSASAATRARKTVDAAPDVTVGTDAALPGGGAVA